MDPKNRVIAALDCICNIKCRLDCRYSPQNIFNAKNFNPHKKPISLLNVPICTQGMQRTWWPEAGTIIVTGPFWNWAAISIPVLNWDIRDTQRIQGDVPMSCSTGTSRSRTAAKGSSRWWKRHMTELMECKTIMCRLMRHVPFHRPRPMWSAAGGFPCCRLLELHWGFPEILFLSYVFNSQPNVHTGSCRSCTSRSLAAAEVRAPASISWAVRLLLSVVPNGDYLVGTWYLHSR